MEMPLQMAIVTRLHMRIVMVILMVAMEMMLMLIDEVSQILPRLMIIVKAMMLESLNNRDYDGYEHVKQFVISAKQWHCTCITLFGTFL